jgi:hypothetical protein
MRATRNNLILTATLVALGAAPMAFAQADAPPAAPVNTQSIDPLRIVVAYVVDYLEGQRAIVQKAEDQRTDRQVGAAPQAPGSTTLTEKATIADLLGFAIERGAIAKGENGSAVTLSTTPYMLLTSFGKDDSPLNWQNYAWARHIGITGTFSSKDVTSGDFSSFTTGELKWTIAGAGATSGRDISRPLLASATEKIRPAAADRAVKGMQSAIAGMKGADDAVFLQCTVPLGAALERNNMLDKAFSSLNAGMTDEQAFAALDKVLGGSIPDDVKSAAHQCASVLSLQTNARQLTLEAMDNEVKAALESMNKRTFSLAALYQRDTTLSDYYTAKLLFDQKFDQPKTIEHVTLNAAVDFNKNSVARAGVMQLHQVRDWSVSGAANSPILANGHVDWNLSAKAIRAKDQGARTVAIAQGQLNLHVTKTATLPIAVSWANRENDTVKKGFQFNIGFQTVLDQLLTTAH